MSGLQSIPPELIEAVCLQLDSLSISRFTQVSRQFWCIFRQSSALQYKVQLDLAGLRDVKSGEMVSAARLDLLKVYQAAWANIDCTRTTKITADMSGDSWELVGNVLSTYNAEAGFIFNGIPSAVRKVPHLKWSLPEVPFAVKDFTTDLSQDILLAVEVNSSVMVVHLFSLTTGLPHPLARNSHLSRDFDEQSGPPLLSCHFQIRIFGEYIGVMIESFEVEETRLLVWEWKSGVMKKHLYSDDMTSFAFLDEHLLLISAWNEFEPVLRILEIEGPVESSALSYFTFGLPHLSANVMDSHDIDMQIQTEPSPSWASDSFLDVPFTTRHLDRLFVVSFGTWEPNRETHPSFLLCVRLSTLLNLRGNSPVDKLPWDQWGPCNTRMLRLPGLPDPWVCFVHGLRMVILIAPSRCQILDFNPLSIGGKRILHEKAVDSRSRVFEQPPTTSAPFTVFSVETSPCKAVMLAEDGIITVSPDENFFTIYSV
ncbi:F-box domain-containing protein [Mycena sanguinolenta]|uniref:F-box domain-containing protein n=1 Tax=Mycena sanguinolenta TaxID=230812 RepID=A0A8H6Y6K1_9AGAR|nr:F-box domain-containing protein [Mycena sanguinolenta]